MPNNNLFNTLMQRQLGSPAAPTQPIVPPPLVRPPVSGTLPPQPVGPSSGIGEGAGNSVPMPQSTQPTPTPQSTAMPAVPPNIPNRVPPQMERFANAQKIQDAFRNNWQPNPVLLGAKLGR